MRKIVFCGIISVCMLVFIAAVTPAVAQTTITVQQPAIAPPVTVYQGGMLHDVPGGFPEGRPAQVDPYIPPHSVITTDQVIYGNAGNFSGGYYVEPRSSFPGFIAPRTMQRRSRPIPGGRVYETYENKGIVTETETLLR